EAAFRRHDCELFFLRNGRDIVELHWGVASPSFCAVTTDMLWDRLQSRNFAGRTVFVLPPRDLLLILCVHGAKHCWQRLAWITDVAELIDQADFDWQCVLKQGSALECERMLLLGLSVARDVVGARLPVEADRRLRKQSVVRSMTAAVRERLFQSEDR